MATAATAAVSSAKNGFDPSDARWDRMGIMMDRFHAYFRQAFKQIWGLADSYQKHGLDLNDYLESAKDFHHHLHFHHNIEEAHIFPILGQRMPEFAKGSGDHLKEHEQIHDGLDRYMDFIKECEKDQSKYSPSAMRDVMASFEQVLFKHLNDEVVSLKGANMHKYWTLQEIQRLPM